MLSSPELVASIQRERIREIDQTRLARIAHFARTCSEASETILERLARAVGRPQPQCS